MRRRNRISGIKAIAVGWLIVPSLVIGAESIPDTKAATEIASAADVTAGTDLRITRMEICASIANKGPQGGAASFKSEAVSRLYCFTEIAGVKEPTYITHAWYYQNKRAVEIKLAVDAPRWRNWSNKTISPQWKGNWKVEVLSAEGKLLKSVEFTIE